MAAPPLTTTPTSTDRFRIVGLDGVRAVAVSVVVVFHVFPGVLPGGYLGVDVFFAVSGFLITSLLLREHAGAGRIGLRGFWLRRARRLLPALGALLLVCTTVAAVLGGDPLLGIGQQLLGALTFSSNWLFVATGSDYFAQTSPELFRHLWSLAVEEQFYLLWPLLLLIVLRFSRRVRIVVVCLLATASALLMAALAGPDVATRVYYGTDTHAFGLLLGALLAVIAERWPNGRGTWPKAAATALTALGVVALAGLLALSWLLAEGGELVFRGGLQLVALLTVLVIAALLVPDSPLARLLDGVPLRWIGVRSYAIYLWHWPLLILLRAAFPASPHDGVGGLPLGLTVVALSLAASAASYRLLEQPMRRDGVRATLRRWRALLPGSRAVAALAAMALIAGSALATTTAILRAPATGQAEAAILIGIESLKEIQVAPAPPDVPSPEHPVEPAPTAGDQIYVIGDSVTLAAVSELTKAFPGIAIDAAVSRSLAVAPDILANLKRQDRLRPVVVVALGTNGPIDDADLRGIRRVIGSERMLVLVNAQAPRDWIPGVNRQLSRFAQAYREVELSNWHDAIQPELYVLAPDQVHFAGAGARIWVRALSDALQRLAELPPLRDDRADLEYPTPG